MVTVMTETEMKAELDEGASAMKALGPLLKLSEISIWDTDTDTAYSSHLPPSSTLPKHIRFKYDDDEDVDFDDSAANIVTLHSPENITAVDRQMALLGLPISFQTKRQNRSGKVNRKINASQLNTQLKLGDRVEESCRSSQEKSYCVDSQLISSHVSSSEHSGCDSNVTNDTVRLPYSSGRHEPIEMGADLVYDGHGLEEHVHASSILNLPAETANDDSMRVDLEMEIEMMYEDDMSILPMTSTSSRSNILDDHLEDYVNLTEQPDAQGSILDTSIMQSDNSGSAIIESAMPSDLSKDTSHSAVVLGQEYDDSGICYGTCGDWSAYWDSFYTRYYFYNAQTKVTTWHPPPGMESFAFDESCDSAIECNAVLFGSDGGPLKDQSEEVQSTVCELNSGILGDHCQEDEVTLCSSLNTVECGRTCGYEIQQEDSNDMSKVHSLNAVGSPCENNNKNCNGSLVPQPSSTSSWEFALETTIVNEDFANNMQIEEGNGINNDLHIVDTSGGTKRRARRKQRRRKNSIHGRETNETYRAEESYIDIEKYWCQRYQLFSRFDEGIKMDEEGWFSVTPEAIARHQASRCGGGTIIDCFTGAGGNAIQFAKTSKHVVAIDIDPYKIDYASHNAAIYGVDDKINFVVGDSFSLASKLKADTVFLSPPWGGPDYIKVKPYSIQMLRPYDGQILFDTFKAVAPQIIMFLPRHVDIEQLAQLALSANPPWSLEVEKNILNGKLKAVTAYFRRT